MSIGTSISLTDRMTPTLRRITASLDDMIARMERTSRLDVNPIDIGDFAPGRAEVERTTASVEELSREIQELGNKTQRSGNTLNNTFKNVRHGIMQTVGIFGLFEAGAALLRTSDTMSQINAKLGLINDGTQSLEELNGRVFASAERARVSYESMATTVSRLNLNAPDAFGTNAEALRFAELLNKQFKISGATMEETNAATLQLTQALGSGVLRGDELNSVFESAPVIMQDLADYLGVGVGELRKMAEEGQLTAEAVKNSMFRAADKTDARFAKIPVTWADRWVQAQNRIMIGLARVNNELMYLANSEGMQNFIENLDNITSAFAITLATIITGMANLANIMYTYWDVVSVPLLTILGLMALYKTEQMIMTGLAWADVGIKVLQATATGGLAGRTRTLTAAQEAYNIALYTCPITWYVAALLLVVGIYFLAVAAVNHFAGTNISAIGLLVGAWNFFWAVVYNIFMALWTIVDVVTVGIFNAMLWVVESVINAFPRAGEAIANTFIDGANEAIRAINSVINALNLIPGVDLPTASEIGKVSLGRVDFSGKYAMPQEHEMLDPFEQFNSGYNWGAGLMDKFFGGSELDKYGKDLDKYYEQLGNLNNPNSVPGAGNTGKDIKDTSKNVADIKDILTITGENVEYLRDIAEREVINRYTTADIKIDLENNNTINSDADIDGMTNLLVEKLTDAMSSAAEGIHA